MLEHLSIIIDLKVFVISNNISKAQSFQKICLNANAKAMVGFNVRNKSIQGPIQ